MSGCTLPEYVGREVMVEIALACGDLTRAEVLALNFMRVGAMTTKSFDLTWDTTDLTTDAGALRAGTVPSAEQLVNLLRTNMATFQSLSVSGDGLARRKDDGDSNLVMLTKHVANPGVAFNNQPVAWVRYTFPDLTFIAYCIITNLSRGAPTDAAVTFSFEGQATSSATGLLVLDTPQPIAPQVITLAPATLELEVGDSQTLTPTFLPVNAIPFVQWSTTNAAVVTVSPSGEVTATGPGSAGIRATSVYDSAVSGNTSVTVTNP